MDAYVMDWARLCHSSVAASDEELAAFEARVATDPDAVEVRVRLVGALNFRHDEAHQNRLGEHLIWLATYRPDVGLSGYGGVLIDAYAPKAYAALREAWTKAAARPDATATILDNAATFLGFQQRSEAEPLYRRAIALEPGDYRWREQLARTLKRLRRPLEAITALEAALERAHEDWIALSVCLELLEALTMAEQWERAVELAHRVLADVDTVAHRFETYGNAVHDANIALGLAARARGELAGASFYLLEAARTPGSPQLNSCGPDTELAKTLFEGGERAAVRAYFTECRRFWSGADDALAALDQLP